MELANLALELASWVPPLGRRGGVRVLCYHGIDGGSSPPTNRFSVDAAVLRQHLETIRGRGQPVLRLPALAEAPAGSVLLTFDDNLASHVAHAVPILRDYGMTAVFYLSPADLGAAGPGRLTSQGAEALVDGGMFVGAHGNHHVPAAALAPAEFTREVQACRRFLETLGMPLTWAYPGGYLGSYRREHEEILVDQGFTVRFTTLEGSCQPRGSGPCSRYVLRRHSSPHYFKAALGGGLQLVRLGKQARALLDDGRLRGS